MSDCPQPCMCPTCYAPYMDEPVTLEDKLAAPDPAAIREAALREAAAVCAGIRQRIANGPMPEGARFDYEQAILALIPKGTADDRA